MALLMFRDSIAGQISRWLLRPQCLLYPGEQPCLPMLCSDSVSLDAKGTDVSIRLHGLSKHEETGVALTISSLKVANANGPELNTAQRPSSDDPTDPKEWATWKKVVVGAEIWYAKS